MVCSRVARMLRRAAVAVGPLGLVLALLVPAGPAGAQSVTLAGSYLRPTLTSGQGLATLTWPGGASSVVYRGDLSIPLRLLFKGWDHIGDPGAGGHPGGARDYLFDAYQGPDTARAKMFEVTTPAGQHYDFVHQLVSGEAYNNSFAAISPDGNWLVSGEWGTMNRLLVFPAPLLNAAVPAASAGKDLPLAGYIELPTPVDNVQGCDFESPTVLLCSSDGAAAKDILQIQLDHALGTGMPAGSDRALTVTVLAHIPLQSECRGTFEAEGIDYHAAQVRVEVLPPLPCVLTTRVYVFDL